MCARCGTTRPTPQTKRGSPRVPSRWKVLAGDFHCPECLASSYVLRTISLPVAGPVDASWDEFRPALREAWIDTTRCANWMLTELYKGDVRRAPHDTKLGPMPRTYLYPEGRARFPNLPAQTVAQLENQTRRLYAAQRYELLWLGARSLATMRYPTPLPIPRKGWSLERSPGGAWHLALFLGQRRWQLRLRGGAQLGRQTAVLSQIVEGVVEAGSLVVRQVSANAGDHRSQALPATRLMVTIPVWIRRVAKVPGKGTLQARPTPDLFLLARADNGCEWRLHGGHFRRVLARSERMHRAIMDDLKEDVRAAASHRNALFDRLGAIAERRSGRV